MKVTFVVPAIEEAAMQVVSAEWILIWGQCIL